MASPASSPAVRTSLYHELFALGWRRRCLLAITHGRANQLGFWTYVTLWWMHESAKLNVFFGVPNLGAEDAACASALSRELHDAAADEHVLSLVRDDLDRGHGWRSPRMRAPPPLRISRRSASRCWRP